MLNLECVPISAYCQMTGETSSAIDKRIERGIWQEGKQVLKPKGIKERWIDLTEVTKWARTCREG
ncbi:TPA: excisionase [Citrobacter werkmanii]|nr:excisionase [Citrobacter freundii]